MRVLLIGGSPSICNPSLLTKAASACSYVVAIDRGLDAALAAGISVNLFCGDIDSANAESATAVADAEVNGTFEVEHYNPAKDDTDLSLALRAIRNRFDRADLICTCLSGGNPDHYLGVLGCLGTYDLGEVVFWDDDFEAKILATGDTWHIENAQTRRFSAIPLTSKASLTERGMRWEVENLELPLLSDRGLSNVIDSEKASITCNDGRLIAYIFNQSSRLA